ncbi:MAG: hypothetical protein JKY54_00390 [Flavobacteriales bacterium]|nr:hypothetical protein [Flavobacteriales bacterium]
MEILGMVSFLLCGGCTAYGIYGINRLQKRSGLTKEDFHVAKRDKETDISKAYTRFTKIIVFGAAVYVGMVLLLAGIRYLVDGGGS